LRSCGDVRRPQAVNEADKIGLCIPDIPENGFRRGMSRDAVEFSKRLADLYRRTCETSDFSDQAGNGGNVSFRNDDATSRW
jgi:hypothetical protein